MKTVLLLMVLVFCVAGACLAEPVQPSKTCPGLFVFQGKDAVKLIGYDYYDLFASPKVPAGLDWRRGEKAYYEEFLDMLAENGCNFTRVFAISPWSNDRFPWRRISGPGDLIKQTVDHPEGERYALLDLSRWDGVYWQRVRRTLEYASKLGIIFEICLVDECGLESGPGDRRWPLHPFNPENNLTGTLGATMSEGGHKDGLPQAYDLENKALVGMYEKYLAKWVQETRGLDNVIFELGNESTSGIAFQQWMARKLRELGCEFPIAANVFVDEEQVYNLPEVDLIATHGRKTPDEVRKWAADWRTRFPGKALMLDSDGWYDSEETWPNTIAAAQTALDLDCHFNHKARGRQQVGPNGELFIQLMKGLRPDAVALGLFLEEMPTALPPGVREHQFKLAQPVPATGGGLFAHELNGDGKLDLVITSEGHVGAYDHSGKLLWVKEIPLYLFEYTHHPSAVAGDLDGDGQQEVAVLTTAKELVVLDGRTGELEKTLKGLGEPIAFAVANLRGLGDQYLILQYDLTHLRAVKAEDGSTLWETNEYRAIEHSPLRQADLDGDGLDEVAGATLIDHDGKRMHEWELETRHESMDSIVIADVIPGGPLEVAMAEQRGANSRTVLMNHEEILWCQLNPWNWEDPDKLAIGDFDPGRPGLEVFNRSSGGDGVAPRGREEPYRYEEAPWVFDSAGQLLARYYINDSKPAWWTGHGIEEISRIDWDGDERDELAAQERHKSGAGAILDALTGRFEVIFPARSVRLYAVDFEGDSREEVIILDEAGVVRILSNANLNPHPVKPSPWTRSEYRRQKQNWNYYSP